MKDNKRPIKVNHGNVWGNGKDWFTFYCPNELCKRQVSGENICPYCGQVIVWGDSTTKNNGILTLNLP